MKLASLLLLGAMSLVSPVCVAGVSSAEVLQETAQDRRDIEALLATYTRAVSTKDQALFETLLLNKDIPFAYVDASSAKVAKLSLRFSSCVELRPASV